MSNILTTFNKMETEVIEIQPIGEEVADFLVECADGVFVSFYGN